MRAGRWQKLWKLLYRCSYSEVILYNIIIIFLCNRHQCSDQRGVLLYTFPSEANFFKSWAPTLIDCPLAVGLIMTPSKAFPASMLDTTFAAGLQLSQGCTNAPITTYNHNNIVIVQCVNSNFLKGALLQYAWEDFEAMATCSFD